MLKRIKQSLLPLYNATYHRLRRAADHVHAVGTGNVGVCNICGRLTPFLYIRRIIPRRLEELWGLTPALAVALARKESMFCGFCGSKLRARRLAEVLLDVFPTSPRSSTIRAWTHSPEVKALRIAEINRIEGLHKFLVQLEHCETPDFAPGAAPGEVVNGVRSEDLTQLTYPDESFDLVVTSETLEHVTSLSAALGEIRRVLVPGGLHLFTVPLLPTVKKTFPRAEVLADGTVHHLAPEIRHPGGDVGYPVFTEFGRDLPSLLEAAGFETAVRFGPVCESDIGQVFLCRKKRSDVSP